MPQDFGAMKIRQTTIRRKICSVESPFLPKICSVKSLYILNSLSDKLMVRGKCNQKFGGSLYLTNWKFDGSWIWWIVIRRIFIAPSFPIIAFILKWKWKYILFYSKFLMSKYFALKTFSLLGSESGNLRLKSN